MEPTANNYNNIFKYAFIGVLLFVAAIGFTLANFSNVASFELSSTVIVSTLSLSSFSLLYKAVKHDKHRLKHNV